MGEFKINATTFDAALRHMKNGGFALAWFGEERDSAALCRFDREKNALQRIAVRGSASRQRDVYTPYAYVVGAPWLLLQTDALVPDPEETATLKATAPEETETER